MIRMFPDTHKLFTQFYWQENYSISETLFYWLHFSTKAVSDYDDHLMKKLSKTNDNFWNASHGKKVDLDLLRIDLILGIAGHRNLNFFNHGEEYWYFVENRLAFGHYIQKLKYQKGNQNILAYKKN